MMNTNSSKTALITGASGGIGYELAKLFARDGYNLVLVARSESKLDQIKTDFEKRHGISVRVLAKDLSEPQAPEDIYGELQQDAVQIDMLVNNAGFTVYGKFAETDLKAELEMLQVNIVSLTHLTKLFLPGMLERRQGRILNVASTAAFLPGPLMAIYYASKAYVLSFSEAIATELRGTGVTVTVLCPGPTQSGFWERGNVEGSLLLANPAMMDAKTVARIGYRAMIKGRVTTIAGFSNWLMVQAVRFTPRRVTTQVVMRIQERV
jgi:hypothetical protein